MEAQNASDVIKAQIAELKDADSLADTPFSMLFHKARTSKSRVYSGVSLQIRVKDGEIDVHNDPVLTRQGEHLRGTDAWDSMITLPVKSFMETRTAKDEIIRQLRAWLQNETAKEARQAEKEQMEEYLQ